MNTSVVRNLLDKAVRIRAFELCHGAVVEDRLDDRVLAPELFEHVGVRRIAAFGLLARGQAKLVKEDLAELLGGIDVEFPSGKAENGLLGRADAAFQHVSE